MSKSSSSTSSSSSASNYFDTLAVGTWSLLFLIAIDLVLGVLFAYPSDPKVTDVSWFRQYLDYGRSTEGKIRRMTRPSVDETAPITRSGWYSPLVVTQVGDATAKKTMTIYGMSHAGLLGRAVARVSSDWNVRLVTAPGATLNWSFGAFLRDGGQPKGSVVVLAVMSAGLGAITATTPMTFNTNGPMPYTSDRFQLIGRQLKRTEPPFDSFSDFVSTLYDDASWTAYKRFLASHDPWYRVWVFDESVIDNSALLRLIRQAYAYQTASSIEMRSLSKFGFVAGSEQVKLANAIVEEFVAKAREAELVPVVYVVNNFGYSDILYRALQPALEATGVAVLNSAALVAANDPRNYLPDSHFTINNDNDLAKQLLKEIERPLN